MPLFTSANSVLHNALFDFDPAEYDGLTRDDLTDEVIRKYQRAKTWRDNHIAARDIHSDPTFRAFLASYRQPKGNRTPLAKLRSELAEASADAANLCRTIRRWGRLLKEEEYDQLNSELEGCFLRAEAIERELSRIAESIAA
ncbi:hypothetical protein G3T36_17285 [Diaminobutyricibacter tongyongensis]|uniref:Uncharacterized protein n=1 Tax=Leifsonia tongyongensis TaxID=1268043 RepID=A0A6L9Y1T6_9MICO|nr:hypothetical protein [Diaminobutyricibacter tongyongensis]NEN07613.1 hypothetical protein [Diaminobutyricibacter tongyongensis]